MLPKFKTVLAIAASACLICGGIAQAPKDNIQSIAAAGKLRGNVYENPYFGVTITAPGAKITAPYSMDLRHNVGRLADVVYDSPDGAMNYTLALVADSEENYPKGISASGYIDFVTDGLQKIGDPRHDVLIPKRKGFSFEASGLKLIGTTLIVQQKPNFGYYRCIYATLMKGYIVSLDV